MKITEKEFVQKIGFDKVARRRTNTSKKTANITALEIENGVTLETLMELNVPVYRYQTQLTIHGKMPSLTTDRVAGYKSLVENGNGTIGVRYNAIDSQKKDILERCNRMTRGTLSVHTNSTGTTLSKVYDNRESCIEGLKLIPDVFIGQKYAGQDVYGRWFVIVEFMAIPESSMWYFIETVYGIKSLVELESIEKVRREKRELEQKQRLDERKKQLELIESNRTVFVEGLSNDGYIPTTINWKGSGTYYVVRSDLRGSFELQPFTLGKIGGKGQSKYQMGDTFDETKDSYGVMKKSFKERAIKMEKTGKILKRV